MAKKLLSRHDSNAQHCISRLKERFGFEIRMDEYRRLSNVLKHQGKKQHSDIEYEFMRKVSLSRTIYRMKYQGETFHAVYSKTTHAIVTVLFTPEEAERYKEEAE